MKFWSGALLYLLFLRRSYHLLKSCGMQMSIQDHRNRSSAYITAAYTVWICSWRFNSIIRIHFIIPIYTISSWLGLEYYRRYIYFQFIRDGYAAFAIASFFNLLIAYVSRNGDYKMSLSRIRPKPWQSSLILPIGLFRKCCGGERGPWRTPRNAMTWYNVRGIFFMLFYG